MKRPDEINSWDFIKEHLYERARKGGFGAEFNMLKARMPNLKRFNLPVDLLRSGHHRTDTGLVLEMVKVYRKEPALRPAGGTILLLIFWDALELRYGHGDRFGDGCVEFLFSLLDKKT